ncbi:MAG: Bug family tripartite tricarboxylate transporter substrate binding protein [Burkholderiales bacterium]
MKTQIPVLICAALLFAISVTVHSQTYSSKPLRLIAPFPAGGTLDTIARTLARPLSRALGQNVIVENRPGGTGVIGVELVARAPADGHTFLMMGTAFTTNAAVRLKLPYDPLKDFAGVARIASNPMLVSVHPSLPVRTLKELVALGRAHPGQLTYATSGSASPMHLAMETFKTLAKVDIIHVPFQGGAPATIAALGGHTSILVVNVSESAPHVAAGKLRALAVTSLNRSEVHKDIPTLAESGFPEFDMSIWYGAWVPAATPKDAVNWLGGEIVRASQLPEVKASLGKLGLSTAAMNPEQFDVFFRAEIQKYEKIARELNLRID